MRKKEFVNLKKLNYKQDASHQIIKIMMAAFSGLYVFERACRKGYNFVVLARQIFVGQLNIVSTIGVAKNIHIPQVAFVY